MSNIAGKAYAMNVISPLRPYLTWVNKLIFWYAAKKTQQPNRSDYTFVDTLRSLGHYR